MEILELKLAFTKIHPWDCLEILHAGVLERLMEIYKTAFDDLVISFFFITFNFHSPSSLSAPSTKYSPVAFLHTFRIVSSLSIHTKFHG